MDHSVHAAGLFNKWADLYQEKYMDVSLYHDTLDIFCALVTPKDAAVLELACGPGNITKYILNRRPDFNILATELAPNMLELAKQNNPGIECRLLDCRNILSLNKKFNAIMCGFCLPYISKEEALQLIADASAMLYPGGVLYISTMENDYSKSGYKTGSTGEQLYMHFHEVGYLTAALQQHNFLISTVKRQNYPEKDGSTTTDLILIAVKEK